MKKTGMKRKASQGTNELSDTTMKKTDMKRKVSRGTNELSDTTMKKTGMKRKVSRGTNELSGTTMKKTGMKRKVNRGTNELSGTTMKKTGMKRKVNREVVELPSQPITVQPLKLEGAENSTQHGFMPLEVSPSVLATTKAKLKKAKAKAKKADGDDQKEKESSVLYVGRIPHGFYEDQMREFFEQFGTIVKLRISRNKKTGRSKGYAFIEFESSEVAKIVAECMNNYLLYGRVLQVHVVPKRKMHPALFKGANSKFLVINRRLIEIQKCKKSKTLKEQQTSISNVLKSEAKRRKKIAAQGIDYEFDGYDALVPPKPKHIKF